MNDITNGMHPPLNEDNDKPMVTLTREQALTVLCNMLDSLSENNRDEWDRIATEYSSEKIMCYHDILKPFGITQVEISHAFEPDSFFYVDQVVVADE